MPAAKYVLTIEAKADFKRSVGFYLDELHQSPANLTGCTASAMVKVHATDEQPLVTFDCTIPAPTTGVVEMELSGTETAKLQKISKAVWDLLLTLPDGSKRRAVSGSVQVLPGVTD